MNFFNGKYFIGLIFIDSFLQKLCLPIFYYKFVNEKHVSLGMYYD